MLVNDNNERRMLMKETPRVGMKRIVLALDDGKLPIRVVGRFDDPRSPASEEQVVAGRMICAALVLMGVELSSDHSPVVGMRYIVPNGGVTVLEVESEINISL